MKTSELLRHFRHADPAVQDMLQSVAEHAYVQGRLDASRELTSLAQQTDKRVRDMLDPPRHRGNLTVVN